jgi:ribosomal protein S18 acetylase RimI-like enzyme
MSKVKEKKVLEFLRDIDTDFPVSLSDKVELSEYAYKLWRRATLCTEVREGEIVGMVAGYTENLDENLAYIALVGVRSAFRHQGIAQKLVECFVRTCDEKKVKGVHLYTDARNVAAIQMYKKLGFELFNIDNESRPEDIHFIRYCK